MLLQCKKCSLFFRSFKKIKHHKEGTLGEQCAGEEKKNVIETPKDDPVDDTNNPWSYNNITKDPEEPVKQEEIKQEEVKENLDSSVDSKADVESVADKDKAAEGEDATKSEDDKESNKIEDTIKKESETDKSDGNKGEIKKEPLDAEVKVKEEPVDEGGPKKRKEAYADGIYRAAPGALDSDSDEFEPESDESAPSDDDVESHLGLTRRLNFKEKARKRKKVLAANATVMYMKNSAGQIVKKYAVPPKESTRWVPPHPWVPYRTQVTVEQVCQFLEMNDYPIVANNELRKKWEFYEAFDDYARPQFEKVNPDAHPLTLKTLIKAKWFELMNIPSEEPKEENDEEKAESKQQSIFPTKNIVVKPPLPKRIRLNWTH